MFQIQAKFSDFSFGEINHCVGTKPNSQTFYVNIHIYTTISFKERGMEQFQNVFINTQLYYTYNLGYKYCPHPSQCLVLYQTSSFIIMFRND